MSEAVHVGPGIESPINPYSLLEAVNDSSDTSHTAWLIFLGLMTYLMIAVAGVSHRDLLLETPVSLPLLQVSIQQAQFFQFAPILLVLFHLGVVSQLVLLARKTLEFDHAVRALETSDQRTHPLRLELHNFFFVQAVAGPHRSYVLSAFLHGMSWLTLVVLPVILLLYIQIRYLPYHDAAVTWAHRIALVADITMLLLIGIFLTRAETSFPSAFLRTGRDHPFTFAGTAILLAIVAFFSFFVATIPGEPLDRIAVRFGWGDPPAAGAKTANAAASDAAGFMAPFALARADGTLFGLFHRNLIATDLDLGKGGDSVLVLRDRDLRYAHLERTDFRGADLTHANLDGANLSGAGLGGVKLQCADINELYRSDSRTTARCVSARGTNFTRARMKDARLAGIDARGARFDEATLEGADMSYALLTEASFFSAHLEGADLSGGTQLQGANFLLAAMQGVDLSGASLLLADLSSAQLQGATLGNADMQGAQLRDADLEGANLSYASLQGADMTRTKLRGADLRGVAVWMTVPPTDDGLQFADLADMTVKALDDSEVTRLNGVVAKLEGDAIKARMREGIAAFTTAAAAANWSQSADANRWQALRTASIASTGDAYKGQITEYLARLMCKARWSNGAVASGIARRAIGQYFRGDMPVLLERLRAKECAASETVSRKALRDLGNQVDIARGN